MNMQISETGIKLITSFEGLRLRAYDDGVGVWTIGYGHTQGVQPGDVITEDEAENLLQDDMDDFERCVNQAVMEPLNQHQFDALVSFAFNVGCGALRRSTLLRNLNAGGYPTVAIADQFLRWNRGGGRVLRGLTRRREAERSLFLSEPEAELPNTPEPEAPKPAGTICSDAILRKTKAPVADNCVKSLQRALNEWLDENDGFQFGPLLVDGVFGEFTEARVEAFQRHFGLTVDGVVGPKTWLALERYL